MNRPAAGRRVAGDVFSEAMRNMVVLDMAEVILLNLKRTREVREASCYYINEK